MANPGNEFEPWEEEYAQFTVSESAQAADLSDETAEVDDLLQLVDESYQIMDAAVATNYGLATYDNLVGGAWQEMAKGRPHIAEGMLKMAGVNTGAFDFTLINLN